MAKLVELCRSQLLFEFGFDLGDALPDRSRGGVSSRGEVDALEALIVGVVVFECAVPAAAKVPTPHSHDAFEETVYGLEGTCTWTIDGEPHAIGPGESVCIRRGQVHGFENRGPPDLAAIGAVMRRHGLTPAQPAAT